MEGDSGGCTEDPAHLPYGVILCDLEGASEAFLGGPCVPQGIVFTFTSRRGRGSVTRISPIGIFLLRKAPRKRKKLRHDMEEDFKKRAKLTFGLRPVSDISLRANAADAGRVFTNQGRGLAIL